MKVGEVKVLWAYAYCIDDSLQLVLHCEPTLVKVSKYRENNQDDPTHRGFMVHEFVKHASIPKASLNDTYELLFYDEKEKCIESYNKDIDYAIFRFSAEITRIESHILKLQNIKL